MHSVIIIPARYASSRFPGKPLHLLAGRPMFQHVYEIAKKAADTVGHCEVWLALDDERVAKVAADLNIPYLMTPLDCATGSDRVLAAVDLMAKKPDFVINLQGDTPLTPANYLIKLLLHFEQNPKQSVLTLAVRLTWEELAQWQRDKMLTPFSGTAVTVAAPQRALWFSKNIIPAIRQADVLQQQNTLSPVRRHVGIYGFSYHMLQTFHRLEPGYYEELEGLEQLRLLEQGYEIEVLDVESTRGFESIGVDTLEDAHRVEAYLAQQDVSVS